MQKHKTLQNLATPAFEHFDIDLFKSPQIRFKGARRHELSDEYDNLAFV